MEDLVWNLGATVIFNEAYTRAQLSKHFLLTDLLNCDPKLEVPVVSSHSKKLTMNFA